MTSLTRAVIRVADGVSLVTGRYPQGADPEPTTTPTGIPMRELERTAADTSLTMPADAGPLRIGIVGAGRVGTALAAALRRAGHEVDGPAGHDGVPAGDVLLLCVPDAQIDAAAASVAGSAAFVGHTSGATPLSALDAAGAQAFGLHPLQTIAGQQTDLRGCGAAVGGSTPAATALAERLAADLGMRALRIEDAQRAAYHASASIASNFLLTLEAAAEAVAAGAGIDPATARQLLGPLVRTTVDNWLEVGPQAALTGPVARGDEPTVAAQRAAVAHAAPELLTLFDELVERTRALADRQPAEVAA
ncbi:MAG: hypothetical protein QOK25_774 [Thermoleophilaceae bacterium]|nr:hypothetical protein [Thermoleophilaceae bacterium]